jgi:hypothetical protein
MVAINTGVQDGYFNPLSQVAFAPNQGNADVRDRFVQAGVNMQVGPDIFYTIVAAQCLDFGHWHTHSRGRNQLETVNNVGIGSQSVGRKGAWLVTDDDPYRFIANSCPDPILQVTGDFV